MSSASVDNHKKQKSAKDSVSHIPRPANCYILFRNDFHRNYPTDYSIIDYSDRMPDLASEAWKQLTEQEKEPWREKARIVKAEHKAKYPDYRFRPIRRKKRKTKGSVIKKRDVEKDGEVSTDLCVYFSSGNRHLTISL